MERYLSRGPSRSAIVKRRPSTGPRGSDRHSGCRRSGSRLEQCPLCGQSFHVALINSHAADCNGLPASTEIADTTGVSEAVPVTNSAEVSVSQAHSASDKKCSALGSGPPTQDGQDRRKTLARQRLQSVDVLSISTSHVAVRPLPGLVLLENPALPGQHLIQNFITESQEAELLAFLDCAATQPPWKPSTVSRSMPCPWHPTLPACVLYPLLCVYSLSCRQRADLISCISTVRASAQFNGRHLGRRWGVGTKLGCKQMESECFTPPLHSMPPLLVQLAKQMRETVNDLFVICAAEYILHSAAWCY